MFDVGRGDALRARRFLWRYGDDLAADLLAHKRADLLGKRSDEAEAPAGELARLAAFREVVHAERSSPHRLRDLAVNGDDLLEAGFEPGPEIGRVLGLLLEAVVEDPGLNRREALLARAREVRT